MELAKYEATPLSPNITEQHISKKDSISFNFKVFNQNKCKKYLGRKMLIKNGYQPIQLTIINNTDKQLEMALSEFNITCLPWNDAAQSVYFHTLSRAIFWALESASSSILDKCNLAAGACSFFSLHEIVKAPEANTKLKDDFDKKAFHEHGTIKPFTIATGLIFVSTKDFKPNFQFKLTDLNSRETFELSTQKTEVTLDK